MRLYDYLTFLSLSRLGDRTRAKASCADLHLGCPSLLDRLHLMEVGMPYFSCLIICMTDIMSKNRPLTADLTLFCHLKTSK